VTRPEGYGARVAQMHGSELWRFQRGEYWELLRRRWPGDIGGGRATWKRLVSPDGRFGSDAEAIDYWTARHRWRTVQVL